jgi:polyisoprenoid-binding protein YceI
MYNTIISEKTKWMIDTNHSEIGFKVKHMMISNITGVFNVFEANIITTGEDFLTAEIELMMNADSIFTNHQHRDEHLKSSDFFDVINHQKINFSANYYKVLDSDNDSELFGFLTIKGITKQIKLLVEFGGIKKDLNGIEKAGFCVNGTINRKDWNLNWNSILHGGEAVIANEVKIHCDIQFIKQ